MATAFACEKEYYAAQRDPGWAGLVDVADTILQGMRRIGLQYKLDHITGGSGNCLFISVLQQLRRPQLYVLMDPSIKALVDNMEPTKLRNLVADFMLTSPTVNDMRSYMAPATWTKLWNETNRNPAEHADDLFIQGMAIFLETDIWVTSPTNTMTQPFQRFSGNPMDRNSLVGEPSITIGFCQWEVKGHMTGHFQSILPMDEPLGRLSGMSVQTPPQVSAFPKSLQVQSLVDEDEMWKEEDFTAPSFVMWTDPRTKSQRKRDNRKKNQAFLRSDKSHIPV